MSDDERLRTVDLDSSRSNKVVKFRNRFRPTF